MKREYRVVWSIEVDASTAEEAAFQALAMQRDPASIATFFTVTERCVCGAFHPEDIRDVDVMDEENVQPH